MSMFRDISIGQYVPAASPVHATDARVKLLLGLILTVILFVIRTWVGFGVITLYVLVVAVASSLSLRFIVRGLRPVVLLILLTTVLHALFTEGTVLWSLGPLRVTYEGLHAGGFLAARLIILLTGLSLVTLTTSPLDMTDAIEWLLGPGRRIGLPAHEVAMMMTIALRFVPTLIEEMERIMKAQVARGARLDSASPLGRVRALVPVLVPLFMSVFRRAEDLGVAMEARCYRGGHGRTRWRTARFRPADYVALSVSLVIIGFVAWRW